MASSRSQVSDLKKDIVQLERRDNETKNKMYGMNGKLNDIITLMSTILLSGIAVKRNRIPGSDIGN